MCIETSGVVVLDKPEGISSAGAVARVKRLLAAAKAGHAGTLDPFATGVLVCCIGQATRLARFFLQGEKTYAAVLRLGSETDTQDATGQVIARSPVPALTAAQLQAVFKDFEGPQMQTPPVYAALKHQGTPLYKLARKGRPVQKPARPVTIRALRLTALQLPEVHFEAVCSSGTYVRALCADIGRNVGCGGHLAALRRTASSGFDIGEAVNLEQLAALDLAARRAALIPMAAALRGMPVCTTDDGLLQSVRCGQRLTFAQVPKPSAGYLKVVDANNNLRAVLEAAAQGEHYNYCCVFP
jgi:tRNA pseudouridine55 synthase